MKYFIASDHAGVDLKAFVNKKKEEKMQLSLERFCFHIVLIRDTEGEEARLPLLVSVCLSG